MEDKYFYPILLNLSDEKNRNLAKKFVSEMGGLSESFNIYLKKWSLSTGIKENSEEFIKETQEICEALLNRIY